MTNDITKLDYCLACGGHNLTLMLDLNDQPLANAFKEEPGDKEPYFPLAVNMCHDCHHLQLTHAVNPKLIYEHYLYVSGTSKTYLHYMHWYAKFAMELYQRSGHHVVCDFWSKAAATEVLHAANGEIDIITSQNAFAHIPDLVAYLNNVRNVMHDNSLMFVSTSQADMVPNDEFDTIYHEHISFFNVKSMKALAERSGLHLIDAIKTPIHGISYVFVLAKRSRPERVKNIIAMENTIGLYTDDTYARWAANTLRLVDELKTFVELYRRKGYILGGYGAAAKGNTLLNFSKIKLDFIIDDNELKQGKYSPGMSIPVVSIDQVSTWRQATVYSVSMELF